MFVVTLEVADLDGNVARDTTTVTVQDIVLMNHSRPSKGFRIGIPQGWNVSFDMPTAQGTMDLAALGPVLGAFPGYVFVSSAHADAKETEAYLMTAAEGKIASLTSQTPGVRVVRPPEIVATRTSMAVVFELDLRGEVRQPFAIIASETRQRVWPILCIIDPAFAAGSR